MLISGCRLSVHCVVMKFIHYVCSVREQFKQAEGATKEAVSLPKPNSHTHWTNTWRAATYNERQRYTNCAHTQLPHSDLNQTSSTFPLLADRHIAVKQRVDVV